MKKIKDCAYTEKTTKIINRLKAMNQTGNETLTQVAGVIIGMVEFYNRCLASWDNPSDTFSPEEIDVGRKCCNAGLDMADGIVNELRILFLEKE